MYRDREDSLLRTGSPQVHRVLRNSGPARLARDQRLRGTSALFRARCPSRVRFVVAPSIGLVVARTLSLPRPESSGRMVDDMRLRCPVGRTPGLRRAPRPAERGSDLFCKPSRCFLPRQVFLLPLWFSLITAPVALLKITDAQTLYVLFQSLTNQSGSIIFSRLAALSTAFRSFASSTTCMISTLDSLPVWPHIQGSAH